MSDNKTTSEEEYESPRENASESSLEDDKLVKKAIGGNEDAYTKLVDKYQRALFFHILKMVKDREQVEDLVQEAFVKAFDNLNTYNTNYAFSTWLYRIATNHTIDYLRKKKLKTLSIDDPVKTKDGEMEIQLPDESAKTDRDIIKKQRKKIVQKAIKDLPEKYRKVIELRHMEEKSYKEIADILDSPLGTVKAHIFRARELLYKELKDKKDRF
ncbi:RNA polymerase sigma factor [Fodinibius halophilus]|uniref:RNA polymerase sigma factor n=1 Tax=Fodinibius halophilus TaxID=1736908 RepID=A0A6M1T1P6_9BACT|nr:sigma-70 family RNA polymerase sigma factor [Fodinibius halophilus]NGP87927.1 sigma-70 family RNA polymerase sigma factor [Fodinibius halophilus]